MLAFVDFRPRIDFADLRFGHQFVELDLAASGFVGSRLTLGSVDLLPVVDFEIAGPGILGLEVDHPALALSVDSETLGFVSAELVF